MSNIIDSDHVEKTERDEQLQKFYRNEFDFYLESRQKLLEDLDICQLKESYDELSKAYYKSLRKMMKITNIGDSTQLKLIKAQETLRLQEEKLRAIFDNAIAGIVTLDLESRFLSYNFNFEAMLNTENYPYFQSRFLDLIDIKDQKFFQEKINSIIEQDISQFRFQIRLKKANEYFWTDVSGSAINDSFGQVESIVLIIADIDEEVRTQNELKESYKKLASAQDEIIKLERRTTALAMAVTANHEINQPLMIMKANLEMLNMVLSDDSKTENVLRYMKRVDESVDRITSILNQFQSTEQVEFEDYGGNTTMVSFNSNEEFASGAEPFDDDFINK